MSDPSGMEAGARAGRSSFLEGIGMDAAIAGQDQRRRADHTFTETAVGQGSDERFVARCGHFHYNDRAHLRNNHCGGLFFNFRRILKHPAVTFPVGISVPQRNHPQVAAKETPQWYLRELLS